MRQRKKENKDNEYVEILQPAAKSWFNMVSLGSDILIVALSWLNFITPDANSKITFRILTKMMAGRSAAWVGSFHLARNHQ